MSVIIYWLRQSSQIDIHTYKKTIKAANIKDNSKKTLKKTYTTDAANDRLLDKIYWII